MHIGLNYHNTMTLSVLNVVAVDVAYAFNTRSTATVPLI